MNVWAKVLQAVSAFRSGDLLGGTIYSLEALTEILRTLHPESGPQLSYSVAENVELDQLVNMLEDKAKANCAPAELLPLLNETNHKAARQLAG